MRHPAPAGREARSRAGLPALVVLVVLAGCGPAAPGPGGAPGPSEACLAVPTGASVEAAGTASATDPLEIGLARPIDPSAAPVPRHADEALLFRLLYEPLVRIDCEGRPYPGLAGSWDSDDGDRRWSFELREGARFWDGRSATASDVASSWSRAERAGREPWGGAPPVSVLVEDERRITVRFPRARADALSLFARPALAVVRPGGEPGWPVTGTGPYRVMETSAAVAGAAGAAAGASSLTLERAERARAGLPRRLRLHVAPSGDLRDLLDLGADLVVTADPRTLDYARLRSDLSTRPLPWSRTYVLAVPAGVPAAGGPDPPAEFLEALARDAVREDARAAAREDDPAHAGRCPSAALAPVGASPPPAASTAPEVITYSRSDTTAREIAERLVALVSATGDGGDPAAAAVLRHLGLDPSTRDPVAVPVGAEELPAALRSASEGRPLPSGAARASSEAAGARGAAYVVGIPRLPGPGCRGASAAGAPAGAWLAGDVGGYRLVPLVQTRRRIVHRSLPASLSVDADGTPYFHAPERP